MKKRFGFIYHPLIVFALVLLGAPTPAKAILYNIQFNNLPADLFTGEAAAAGGGELGTYWNSINGKPITIPVNIKGSITPDGAAVPTNVKVSLSLSGATHINVNSNSFQGTTFQSLMGSYIYSTNYIYSVNHKVITFQNLTPDKEYALYIYSQGAKNLAPQQLSITTQGYSGMPVTKTTLPSDGTTKTLVEGLNYLVVDVITDSNGTLVIDYGPATGSKYGIINSLELSSTPHAPEPATIVLLSIGGMLVAVKLKGKAFKELKV